ncbi:MAG: hypothetical protein AABX17_03480 [Nanoarchaeota archaeon]
MIRKNYSNLEKAALVSLAVLTAYLPMTTKAGDENSVSTYDSKAQIRKTYELASQPFEIALETPKEVKSSPLEIKAVTDSAGNIGAVATITIGPKYERGFWKGLTDNLIPYRRAKDSADGKGKLFPYFREKPIKCIVTTIVEGGLITLTMSGGGSGGSSQPAEQPANTGSSGSGSSDSGSSGNDQPAPAPQPPSDGGSGGL